MKRRSFKRASSRPLSVSDLTVIDFLWLWKVANSSMLKLAAYKDKSNWWVYKSLRQLQREKYIQLLPRGKYIDQELWVLTDNGFEAYLMDRDDLQNMRYRPHAPTHDFLASALQLGNLWQSGPRIEKQFFTEQMLSSLPSSNFPRKFRSIEEHIPDGVTLLRCGAKEALVGYEVDINFKNEDRYSNTFRYHDDGLKTHLIIWLVRNNWIAERIGRMRESYRSYSNETSWKNKYAFFLPDDFISQCWGAKAIGGPFEGMSIEKLHTNLLQNIGYSNASIGQTNMSSVSFQKYKSPQKIETYK